MFVTYSLIVNRSDVYNNYVSGQRTHSLIYTHKTHQYCSYFGTYLLFCMCFANSVSFIKFLIES